MAYFFFLALARSFSLMAFPSASIKGNTSLPLLMPTTPHHSCVLLFAPF